MKSMHILSSLANRSVLHLRRILFRTSFLGLFFLLCSASAWGQGVSEIVAISYVSGNSTYYLAANSATSVHRTNALSKACLWKRVQLDNGQYTLESIGYPGNFMAVGQRQGFSLFGGYYYPISLSATGSSFDIQGNAIYYNDNYPLQDNGGTWRFHQSNSTAVDLTNFHAVASGVSHNWIKYDDNTAVTYLTWLEPTGWQYAQQVLLQLTYTFAEDGYQSEDGKLTIGTVNSRQLTENDGVAITYVLNPSNYDYKNQQEDPKNYVNVTAGPVWDATKNGWLFTIEPTVDDPKRAVGDEIRNSQGAYDQWLSHLIVSVDYTAGSVSATFSPFYLARATFRYEEIDDITLDITPSPSRWDWQEPQPQDFYLRGTRRTGTAWISARNVYYYEMVDTDPNLNLDNAEHRFLHETLDENIDWMESVNDVLSSKVTLNATGTNGETAIRRARWVVIYRYLNTKGEQKAAYLSTIVEQGSRYSNPTGLHLEHQKGMSGSGFTEVKREDEEGNGHEIQSVHKLTTPIYYIDNEPVYLYRKERGFLSWARWYDYDYRTDLADHWATRPQYYDGTTSNNTANPSTDLITIGDPGHTHGIYFRRNEGNWNSWSTGQKYDAGEDQTHPAVVFNDSEPHRIACDMSNYIDYTYRPVRSETEYPDLSEEERWEMLTEPTLSCRQIFELIPAKDRVGMMKKSERVAGTRYNADGETYLEEYVITAPTGEGIVLSPQCYYTNYSSVPNRLAYFGYIYQEGTVFKRVGTPEAQTAQWYENGVALNTGITSNENSNILEVSSDTEGEVVYTLETADYNLCRFRVNYKDINKVGPVRGGLTDFTDEAIAKNYTVLEKLDFNETGKEGTDYTSFANGLKMWNHPLPWYESSFGFKYNDDSKRHPSRRQESPFSISYGEYALVNWISSDWWRQVEQRGGKDNGYMLYVDGTSESGLVVSLETTADLCAGQKMYCSAWVGNPSKNADDTRPVLLFVIEGRENDESPWKAVSEYTTGALEQTGTDWAQVCFEIDLQQDYKDYRIAIYNYATKTKGNDFVIDDICIFASRRPVTAYQTASLCSEDYVDAVIRLDYNMLDMEAIAANGYTMYCQVYNETKGEVVKMNYLNNPNSDYGYIVLPVTEDEIPASEKYDNLADFFATTAAEEDAGEFKKVGYLYENVSGDMHWVVYVRHRMPSDKMGSLEDKYLVRVGYTEAELSSPTCALETYLPVRRASSLQVNGRIESNPVLLCGNSRYDLSLRMEVVKTDANGDPQTMYGMGLNDWIMIFNQDETVKDIKVKAVKEIVNGQEVLVNKLVDGNNNEIKILEKYSYQDIENALRHDLRQVLEDSEGGNTNKNYGATTLTEIDPQAMNPKSYQLISELVEAGLLILASESISPYIQDGERVSCLIMPIKNSGYAVNDKGEEILQDGKRVVVDQCFFPRVIEMYTDATEYTLELGSADETLPVAIQSQPMIVRCSLTDVTNLNITIPIRAISDQTTIGKDIKVASTTDPSFDVDKQQYYFTHDYISGREINLREHTSQNEMLDNDGKLGTLKAGYDYTFAIPMKTVVGENNSGIQITKKDEDGKEVTIDCAVGEAYFTLRIVPDYVKWQPLQNNVANWNDDANWVAVDDKGKVIEGANGFVPMDHTNVIIPKQTDESRYPVLVDPTTYIDNHQGLNSYDGNYQPASCKYIYLESGAKLYNQHYLQYEKAFVDWTISAGEWNLFSPALQDTYVGDIYTPGDPTKEETDEERAKYDSDPFNPTKFNGNRYYDYIYYHSFYNQTVDYMYETGETQTGSLTEALWSDWVNNLGIKYEIGKAYAILGYGPTDQDGEELRVRLPKSDEGYYYYQVNNDGTVSKKDDISLVHLVRTNAGKFAYKPTGGKMTITLRNTKASNMFVFGNPTMAYLDMQQFLSGNSSLSKTFYVLSGKTWQAVDLTLNQDYRFVPPMSGVKIQLVDEKALATTLDVIITPEMLLSAADSKSMLFSPRKMTQQSSVSSILEIKAVNGEIANAIYIGESPHASDGIAGEDAYALASGLTGTGNLVTPLTLHTDNQGAALAIDIRQYLTRIPLLFAVPDASAVNTTTDLWFTGVEQFTMPIYLEDTQMGTEVQILNGLRVTIDTPTSGEQRYFIRMRDKKPDVATEVVDSPVETLPDVLPAVLHVEYTNLPTESVMVSANAQIEKITVFDITGRVVTEVYPKATSKIIELPQGVYLLRTYTRIGEEIGKVIIE